MTRPMPLTIVNDEGGGAAPPMQIARFLSDHRGRGIVFILAIQSNSQSRTIFGEIGRDFFTLFRQIMVFRGIMDGETLDLLSKLADKTYVSITSRNSSQSKDGWSRGESVERQLVDKLRAGQIAQGHPEWADSAMFIAPDAGYLWFKTPGYFRGAPWPALIVNAIEHTLDTPSDLPIPTLAKGGDFTYLERLGLKQRWLAVKTRIDQYRSK